MFICAQNVHVAVEIQQQVYLDAKVPRFLSFANALLGKQDDFVMVRMNSPSGVSRSTGSQALFLLAVLLPLVALSQAQDRPVLRAGVLPEGFQLTGTLNDSAWRDADAIENLTTIEPIEGGVPTGRTIVKVLANRENIVIGIVCEDPDPGGIVSFSKARDSYFRGEDSIRIVFDTFMDGRSGYIFAVNPEGARFDALVSGTERDNSNWDTIWEAKTSRDSMGWSAEIKIPLKSLSFNGALREWGFNVERQMQRLQETSRWASPLRDYRINQTSRSGLLVALPEFDFGRGLSMRPAVSGGAGQLEIEAATDYDIDASLDVTQKIGSNLVSSLTINTDFAETEVDTRRTNLTRFPMFFPEKRTFFLEGADIFQFGSGGGRRYGGGGGGGITAFHSRRIGLLSGTEVPLVVGGKLSGRVGNTNLGVLAVRTNDVSELVTDATMGVVRIKQNILEESSIGMIATVGDPENLQGAWTLGTDFIYQTSRFRGDKNFSVGAWFVVANRDDLEGDKTATGLKIDYPNNDWDISFSYTRIGESFDPSLGFVSRRRMQSFSGSSDRRYRPSISWIRWNYFELRPSVVTDLDGNWESYKLFTAPVNLTLESGDRFEFNANQEGERLIEPFEIAEGVIIPPGSYHWQRYRLEWAAAPQRVLSGQITWWFGPFYEGSLDQINLRLTWKFSSLFNIEFSGERNIGNLPQGEFIQERVGTRLNLNFSPDLVFNSYVQYDNLSRSVGTNTKLRWTFAPVGDLFVVYNHNIRDLEDRWLRDSNQLVVKLQYALRY